jgi:photosystem II stability/assembly factor-like uncharacterized protein
MLIRKISIAFTALLFPSSLLAQNNAAAPKASDSLKNISTPAFTFRSIGPAITGGRITDIAVNGKNTSEYYVASGHGSLWKTSNNGTTFSPAFEGQTSFAMGSVKVDPSNPSIIWVGTGENNNQNNAIYGDGVYKSEDGGKSWSNMGLKNSEHIGGIVIDPNNSNNVYVAAYGSLRNTGGDRGIYKTTDGGKSWKRVLFVSDNTGFFEVHMDPRNSNAIYAVAHQRMRKGYTGIGGGNESAIYRSVDGGESWQKIMKGLPSENVGRVGMAISAANPDILYALVQAKEGSGLYKSDNRGATWVKQSSYISAYPFYMQKLYADPKDENRVYSMDLVIQVSTDAGKNFRPLGEKFKHVDNHVLWIDPSNTRHLISGNDGGVYETWDQGANWAFKSNIPIAEVYKVATDNAVPFYNVYIGTQDNSSLVGPSRTNSSAGILNQHWTYTVGGDGFESQADWKDDNIVYAQYQNGGLMRYDKRTGEQLFIQPVSSQDTGFRFDWDAALLISKHDNKRLYFGADKLFRTDDQGNSWKIISPDLTRGVPQKMQKLMGRSWSIDELSGKSSLANISTIAESPLDENVLFAGTADGLIQFTTDGGKTWTKGNLPAEITEFTRIHHIIASNHNKNVAYAAAHAFNYGDYKPYLLKTMDGGKTWSFINGNLPEKGSTYTVAEDHIKSDLLFVGTQFGLYMSNNGGKEWIKFMNGLPVTSVMDLEIQQRENDLVVGTFGRGVYILDNYSALRNLNRDTLQKQAVIFPIKDAQMYIETKPFARRGRGFQGASMYSANNPPVGATFTYFVKDDVKSLKQKRNAAEKEMQKKGEDVDFPNYETLKKESEQPDPYLLFTITDDRGDAVRKIKTNISKGVQRITWDLRTQDLDPISLSARQASEEGDDDENGAYLVVPGTYKVSLQKFEDGKFTELVAPQAFKAAPLNKYVLNIADKAAWEQFNKKVGDLYRAMSGANAYRKELADKIPYLKQAALSTPNLPSGTYEQVLLLQSKMEEINRKMNGDNLRARYEGAAPPSLKGRVDNIVGSLWSTTSAPTETFKNSYNVVADNFESILTSLRSVTAEFDQLETTLEKFKAAYTPGRLPVWSKN